MGISRTTKLTVSDEVFEVTATELVPGAWSWVVSLGGHRLFGSAKPEPSYHGAYFAALSHLRTGYPDRHNMMHDGRPSSASIARSGRTDP